MIALEEAQGLVLRASAPFAPVELSPADALGCVLAAPAFAALDVPPFANSAMDGYAVQAADTEDAPVTLEVVGRVLAGATLPGEVGPGQAARIMTGAPLPPGADAVCMVERTRASGEAAGEGRVVIEVPVSPGENVRDPGGDVRAGDVVLEAGAEVGPTQLAALLSSGCPGLRVHPRPRVGVISTGDELVEPGEPLGPAQIYDSNRPMLLALVAEAGCDAVDVGRSPDDEDALAARIADALGRVDVLVLSGGVSVGDVDVVRMVLDRIGGAATHWLQIAIRPAKPFSFSVLTGPRGAVPVFGLPGNPVSSAVSFELLVRPALRVMGGHRVTRRPRVVARAAESLRRAVDGRTHFVRVQLTADGGSAPVQDGAGHDLDGSVPSWVARPCPGQGSHQIRSMGLADGLAVLADGNGVAAGDAVEVVVTNPALAAAFVSMP
ncbi:MAG TPA: gephyrin-like molybdotransferase Glp [Acidimicrobiales bacterium]|nr:gephyrin-like molybdotransferase Glp [Acidimicrobiales bacterium]